MLLLLLLIFAILAVEVAVDIEVAEGFGSSYNETLDGAALPVGLSIHYQKKI